MDPLDAAAGVTRRRSGAATVRCGDGVTRWCGAAEADMRPHERDFTNETREDSGLVASISSQWER